MGHFGRGGGRCVGVLIVIGAAPRASWSASGAQEEPSSAPSVPQISPPGRHSAPICSSRSPAKPRPSRLRIGRHVLPFPTHDDPSGIHQAGQRDHASADDSGPCHGGLWPQHRLRTHARSSPPAQLAAAGLISSPVRRLGCRRGIGRGAEGEATRGKRPVGSLRSRRR